MADKKISQLTAAATPLVGTEVFPIVQSGATVKATIADVQAAPIAAQTASSMLYLNASKVPSTTANATFDGTNLGLGASPSFYGGRLAVGGHIAISGGNSLKLWNTGGTGLASLTSTGTNGLTIAASGNTTLSDGSLVIGTAGKGIDFSANAHAAGMTSELLNDYEEGTWTPTITSAAGTITLVDTTGSKYTKIGRYIYVLARLGMTTDASVGTSDLTIGGLPYTVVTAGMGNLVNSNYSASDFGTGGAHGIVRATGSNILHANRTVDMSSRSSTFYWTYNAVYEAS